MLKVLFCLTQLNSKAEPKNGPERAAVSIVYLKSDGAELGLTLTDWRLITYVSEPSQFSHRTRGMRAVLMSGSEMSGCGRPVRKSRHSQVSVFVLTFCFGGQGQTVQCTFGTISPTRVWSDHIRTVQPFHLQSISENMCPSARPFFQNILLSLTNSSGRSGPIHGEKRLTVSDWTQDMPQEQRLSRGRLCSQH